MPKGYVQNILRVLKCKLEDALSVIVRFQVPPAAMLPFDGAAVSIFHNDLLKCPRLVGKFRDKFFLAQYPFSCPNT